MNRYHLSLLSLSALGSIATGALAGSSGPSVRVESKLVRGDVRNLADVTKGIEVAVAPCYTARLVKQPDMEGQLKLALVARNDGKAELFFRDSSGSITADVADCVESFVKSVPFASDDKGARVILTFYFTPGEREPERDVGPEFHGYLQPAFGYTYRSQAVPQDRVEYGATASRAGFSLEGERFENWHYAVHLVVDATAIAVLSDVELVDSDGGGTPEKLDRTNRDLTGTFIEEISIRYQPFEFFGVKAGQMRIPFTVAHQSANTALMFPTRAGPNEVFLSGSDRGMLAEFNLPEGRSRVSAGAFNGDSLLLSPDLKRTRGLVYSLRTDVEPLGKLSGTENDFERGPFKFGVGFGLLYRDSKVYDATGYESTEVRDVRVSASLRAAFKGIYLQSEIMRRLRTDNLSSRPQQTTGYYGQASYYLPVGSKVAFSPIARVGKTIEDQTVEPLETLFLESGIAFFPAADEAPQDLRLLVQYVGERRVTEEGENAHGVAGQLSYTW